MVRVAALPATEGIHVLAEGRNLLAASSDGNLVACGADDGNGSVTCIVANSDSAPSLMWSGAKEGLPMVASAVGVAHSAALVAFADLESNSVALYSVPGMVYQRSIARPAMAVRAVAFSVDDARIAVGGDDLTIRVVQQADPTEGAFDINVGRQVKSLHWDPRGRFLAVSCLEGSIAVYDLEAPAHSLVKRMEGVKVADSDSSAFSAVEYPIAWHPSGDALAIGTDAGATVLRREGGWEAVYKLGSPSAVAPGAADKLNGTQCLSWSPNGRFLAAVDARRVFTIWDFTTPAEDALTHTPHVANALTGAGEPRVVLHGLVRQFNPAIDPEDAVVAAAAKGESVAVPPVASSSPRPTGMVWMREGGAIAIIDTDGALGAVNVGLLEAQAGSPTEPLSAESPLQWPLKVRSAAAASSAGAAKKAAPSAAVAAVLGAAEAGRAGTAAGALEAEGRAAARRSGGAYGEGEAMEGAASDEEAEEEEEEMAKAVAAVEAKTATKRPPPAPSAAGTGGDPLSLSLSDMKRRHGFVDDDEAEVGEDGVGGIRYVEDGGAGAGGPAGGPGTAETMAALLASGRLVTRDALEAHTILTGRYIREIYGFVAPQLPFQPGSTAYRTPGDRRSLSLSLSRNAAGRFLSPSSAPRGSKRYLAWNSVGALTSRVEGTMEHTIDCEFTDSSRHRSLHLSDAFGFSLGALGNTGVLLATAYVPPRSSRGEALDRGAASILQFTPLGSWGAGGNQAGSWQVELPVFRPTIPAHRFGQRSAEVPDPAVSGGGRGGRGRARKAARSAGGDPLETEGGDDGAEEEEEAGGEAEEDPDSGLYEAPLDTSEAAESPLSLGVGEGWVAAATDRQLVRFFRSSGVQDAVVAVAGAPVCLAAHGALCAVAYHASAPSNYTQHIRTDLFLYKGFAEGGGSALPVLQASVDVPLRSHTTLAWMGFSPEGQLVVHDSSGTLLALQAGLGWAWTPVGDTRAAAAALALGVPGDGAAADHRKRQRPDTRDSYWPVGVEMVPADSVRGGGGGAPASVSVAASSSSSSSAAATAPRMIGSGGSQLVPALLAVLCKGAATEPAVSAPRPLAVPLPLRLPLLEAGATGAFDDEYLRWELRRLHRTWTTGRGLDNATAAPLALSTALAAASANLRGDSTDAAEALVTAYDEASAGNARDTADIDKGLVKMVKVACDSSRDVRAFELATRLHSNKSIEVAATVAQRMARIGVAERISALLTVRAGAELVAAAAGEEAAPQPQLQQGRQRGHSASESSSGGGGHAAEAAGPRFGLGAQAPCGTRGGTGGSNSAAAAFGLGRGPAARGSSSSQQEEGRAIVATSSSGGPFNPFSNGGGGAGGGSALSPVKRKPRDTFDALNMSPGPGAGAGSRSQGAAVALNRQSSLITEVRAKQRAL